MLKKAFLLLWILGLATGCVGRPGEARSASDLDAKLSLTSFIEEGNLVALVAGTRPTRVRSEEAYVPLEIVIVNKGLPGITLTAESFTLVDEDGGRYPAVGRDELARGYGGSVDADRRLGEAVPVVRGKFSNYTETPSTLTASFDRPIEQKLVLPRFSFAADVLYFPRPTTDVRGHVFELFMDAPELEAPVFIRFKVAS